MRDLQARLRSQLFQWMKAQGDYLGAEGPVVFLQGRQHELDEPSARFNYSIPDELVGCLKGLKNDPHVITGPDAKPPVVPAPIVAGGKAPPAAGKPAGSAEGLSLEQFLENKRTYCAQQGKEFSEEKYVRMFRQLDTDGDGVLIPDEWTPGGKKK